MAHVGGHKAVKWIIAIAFAGWFAIVGLAVAMAQHRLNARCEGHEYCMALRSGARDGTLLFGLTVALIGAITVALKYSAELSGLKWRRGRSWRPTKLVDTDPISLPDHRDR